VEQRGQLPHFPVYRTSRNQIWDINKRIQWCNVAVRANELPPGAPEHGLIELYLAKLSEGLPMDAPGIRH
jgi:sulfur-oxidizing protein SoxA